MSTYAKKSINKIWIELDIKNKNEHDELQCKRANKLLKKLGFKGWEFWLTNLEDLNARNARLNITKGAGGQYTPLADKGEWFNLDWACSSKLMQSKY